MISFMAILMIFMGECGLSGFPFQNLATMKEQAVFYNLECLGQLGGPTQRNGNGMGVQGGGGGDNQYRDQSRRLLSSVLIRFPKSQWSNG